MIFSENIARMKHIALYGHQHSARVLLALAETFWFLTLLWPGDTFSRPIYAVMALFAGEAVWGLVFLVCALSQWSILFTGRYHTRPAVWFAGCNMVLWWFVVISMYLSVYPPPAAISGELALAFGASWVYVRSGWGGHRGTRFDDA